MLLALEAMGGDNAPGETCAGAIMACEKFTDLEIALVGDSEAIAPLLVNTCAPVRKRHLVHAEEDHMDEPPRM